MADFTPDGIISDLTNRSRPWQYPGDRKQTRPADTATMSEELQMDALAEKLDKKLQRWEHATAEDVRRRVAEIMELLRVH